MGIKTESFGEIGEHKKVTKYILENKNGMKVALLDLGADIVEIWVPDKDGVFDDITLGYDNALQYATNEPAFGAVIGRYTNRISNASFTLNGKKYELDKNDITNCLHSGFNSFAHHIYDAECTEGEEECSVSFTRLSPDMEQGFPGNATITITYTLNDADELMLEYYAVCDEDTIVNMTNHNYFNIGKGGHKYKSVLKQKLQIAADFYTPVDEVLAPTGEIRSVKGTALDFNEFHLIGERIGKPTADESIVEGYDHNFVLRKGEDKEEICKIATYIDEESGRCMEVFTDAPAMQVYSSIHLSEPNGKDGMSYTVFSGICFETQGFPDAVNHENFPNSILKAGEEYEHTTIFRFSLAE